MCFFISHVIKLETEETSWVVQFITLWHNIMVLSRKALSGSNEKGNYSPISSLERLFHSLIDLHLWNVAQHQAHVGWILLILDWISCLWWSLIELHLRYSCSKCSSGTQTIHGLWNVLPNWLPRHILCTILNILSCWIIW